MFTKASNQLKKAGLLFLMVTLFLVSFPRSWSPWPLGLFLGTGLLLWITGFKNNYLHLKQYIFIILPPVIYFMEHLISVLIQGDSLIVLTDRLMFLLVPIFGLPLFVQFTSEDDALLFKSFITGIILVSIILVIRILIFVDRLVPEDTTFFEYSKLHKYWFISAHVSVFEHPSYLSMKIMWVLLIFIFVYDKINISIKTALISSLLLSIFMFFLASRASILFWMLTVIFFLFRMWRIKVVKPGLLIVLIPFLLLLAGISAVKIERIRGSLNEIRLKTSMENYDWKNIDQRTREWYSAIQVIREKPVFGTGLSKAQERLVEEYVKNGFNDEATLRLNAHNQFLEAQMTFGISGTMTLLWMLLTPLFLGRKLKYPHLAAAFVVMISFFLVFESMFNRQWGIMFFMIFYFMLSKWTIAPDQSQ